MTPNKSILYSIGLTETEANTYLIILEKGKLSRAEYIAIISKQLNLKEDEVNQILNSLIKKTVIIDNIEAISPDNFIDKQK